MVRHRVDQGRVVHAKAAELIATSWRHTTARAVGERVPDPQLHSHVLLHAAVRDGKLVAIDSRSWLVHRRELGAAYRTELARELTAGVRDHARHRTRRALLRDRRGAAGADRRVVKPPPSGAGGDPADLSGTGGAGVAAAERRAALATRRASSRRRAPTSTASGGATALLAGITAHRLKCSSMARASRSPPAARSCCAG